MEARVASVTCMEDYAHARTYRISQLPLRSKHVKLGG